MNRSQWAAQRRVTRSKARLGLANTARVNRNFVVCTVAYTPKPRFWFRLSCSDLISWLLIMNGPLWCPVLCRTRVQTSTIFRVKLKPQQVRVHAFIAYYMKVNTVLSTLMGFLMWLATTLSEPFQLNCLHPSPSSLRSRSEVIDTVTTSMLLALARLSGIRQNVYCVKSHVLSKFARFVPFCPIKKRSL